MTRCESLPNVNPRPSKRLVLRLAQDLARDRGRISLAEDQKLQQVRDGIPLCPPEVDVWELARAISNKQEERGDRIRNSRALTAQHAVSADFNPPHDQDRAELRAVAGPPFQKQHRIVGRQMM